MIVIKIVGPASDFRDKLATVTQEAVDYFKVEAEIILVSDKAGIKAYKLPTTPGLVINELLTSSGRIPSQGEIITWMADALEATPND